MGLDHVDDSIQNLDWSHQGKRYVDAFESGMYMAPWRLQRVISFLRRIEIYPDESKSTRRKKGEIETVRQESSLCTVKTQGHAEWKVGRLNGNVYIGRMAPRKSWDRR